VTSTAGASLESGRIDIVRELVGGDEVKIATIRPGEYFGELGPMLGLPRSARAIVDAAR